MSTQPFADYDALISEAESRLGATVLPFQREWLRAFLAGERVIAYTGRRVGWTTARRVEEDIRTRVTSSSVTNGDAS